MIPTRRLWIVFCLLLGGTVVGALAAEPARPPARRAPDPSLAPIEDRPGLPRVLLIGDSISMGYTLPVRKLLQDEANVHRPSTNCGPTTTGLQQIDRWLGDGKWAVIHFNWGLHDLKYVGSDGRNLADPTASGSRQLVPPKEYEQNLRTLVERLKRTGARLIWCSTTPVPTGATGRVPGDDAKYNAIAAKVMKEHKIAINDLNAFANSRLQKIQRPANVHFTDGGSEELAGEVARAIRGALGEEK